jgi:S-DNA-T family DNA segregation ATPase FtsK/SpoIIIE
MDTDDLKEITNTLVNKSKELENVPINLSLTEKYILGIVGKNEETREFVKQIILQIITFHSYEDVKLIFFVDDKTQMEWDYSKILPHAWSNDKQVRFFATTYEEMCDLSGVLERSLESRFEDDKADYRAFSPYYIIITDNFKIAKNVPIVIKALKLKKNIGMNVIVLNENLSTLPNECTTFLSISAKNGAVFESELTSDKQKEFIIDNYTQGNFVSCCKKVANIPIKFTQDNYNLPNVVDFLEMYGVGKVEQLNANYRWKMSNPTSSLQVPVGIDSHGMLFKIDIHEKAHGPHGLIAGMTGSGKSEFIISYVLSLAVNYHPDDVSFVLIDYKGGGLAGAFKNEDTGVKLPHLAGTITNLDTLEMNRSLVSIQSELRRRQSVFNDARQALNEGTIDIYKYQKFYKENLVKDPVSHLLIISDEFAELKAQQPEFMDQLISAARIGRSLGVHLILATQKPSGVVNDQIWSNARFRICLKVQDKADSNDMIKVPDAAMIKQTGRFYLQVGYNEFFALGQSAWSGAPYFPTEKVKKKIDTAMNFVNNIGYVVKESDEIRTDKVAAQGEQLTNIVKYLSDVAKKEHIEIKQLWLDKIPAIIYLDKLTEKYHYVHQPFNIAPVIGEFDDPFNQRQGILTLPISTDGNTIVYGSAGSGKEQMLNAIIYNTITNHKAEEVNFYILEFGAESLRVFSKAPHVGDILYINDAEKINNLFKMLKGEVDKRKKLFSDFSGDYQTYIKSSGNTVPTFIVIINNYEAFNEVYQTYEDIILQLTREGSKYGIFFLFTTSASNMIRYRLAQNFGQKLVLRLNDESDYSSILGNVRGTKPSDILGRGLINLGSIYEFQTASIVQEEQLNETIRSTCEKLRASSTFKAKAVPILPEKVTFDYVRDAFNGLNQVPIGIEKKSLEVSSVNLRKGYVTMLTSLDITILKPILNQIAKEINMLNEIRFIAIDTEELIENGKLDKCEFINNNLDEVFTKIYEEIQSVQEAFQNSNFDKNSIASVPSTVIFISGLDKFMTKLTPENKKLFGKMFELGKELDKYSFLLIDSVDKFKKVEYDDWYRATVNNTRGIWIGDGIANQFSIKLTKTTKDLYDEIGNKFGYVVERGNPTLIKLLEEGNGDDN